MGKMDESDKSNEVVDPAAIADAATPKEGISPVSVLEVFPLCSGVSLKEADHIEENLPPLRNGVSLRDADHSDEKSPRSPNSDDEASQLLQSLKPRDLFASPKRERQAEENKREGSTPETPSQSPSLLTESPASREKPSRAEVVMRRLQKVVRKKDFVCREWIRGESVNAVQGLELHEGLFNRKEQEKLIDMVYKFQQLGQQKLLQDRTYTQPRKWMPGKGRETIQFGCCYNYAVDSQGNPPGIMQAVTVDPIPPLLKTTIRRLIQWQVLPEWCVPDSCIINIYDVEDCIPPHIDHHDFLRPFCTVSLLSECNIVFGSKLKISGGGLFTGPLSVPLPMGSVLVFNGNAADVAKHAVPGVPSKRISITFRKMDPERVPDNYEQPKDLLNVKALSQKTPE